MKPRRRRELPELAQRVARQLKQCETKTALLDRVRPANLAAERERLTTAASQGQRPAPSFCYGPAAELGAVRRALSEASALLDATDAEQALLLLRIEELELEACMAEHIGLPQFAALAARRFPLPADAAHLFELANREAMLPADCEQAEATHFSDDESDPQSLFRLVSERVFATRLPVRVEAEAGLIALAAVADGVVRVRRGVRLSAAVGRRIALHEVEGHLLPRARGGQLGGVFLAGSRGAVEDEEGRAILLEGRAGLLSRSRRAELARRYLAASSVRRGADFWETYELLRSFEASAHEAVELAIRVHRGGGLGRELIYFSGHRRVESALRGAAALEALLEYGRVSLDAAGRLLAGSIELDHHRDVI